MGSQNSMAKTILLTMVVAAAFAVVPVGSKNSAELNTL